MNKGDADYERLWRLVNDANKGRYDEYQKKTARPQSPGLGTHRAGAGRLTSGGRKNLRECDSASV